MRTVVLAIFISVWVAVAVYVAFAGLVSALRRRRPESAPRPILPPETAQLKRSTR